MITRSGFVPARPMHFGIMMHDDEEPVVVKGAKPLSSEQSAALPKNDQDKLEIKRERTNESLVEAAKTFGGIGGFFGYIHEVDTLKPGDNAYIEVSKGLLGGGSVGIGFALLMALGVKAVRRVLREEQSQGSHSIPHGYQPIDDGKPAVPPGDE
jgi:hypothetical protein